MTCNAIATASASVLVDSKIAALLDAAHQPGRDLIRALMVKALATKGLQASEIKPGMIVVAYYKGVNVTVAFDERTNRVNVTMSSSQGGQFGPFVDQLAATVTQFLTAAAGLALQQKIKAVMIAKGTKIESEQRAADGSLVLKVEF